jgi:hypothetical protein
MESEETKLLKAELLKNVSEEKLEKLVSEKESQFHGLLTREAALFAVSREMKVELPQKPLSVSEMSASITRATILARVNRIFEVKRFEKGGKSGKVCRLFVGDEKKELPLVLWNEDVNCVEQGRIAKDDLLEIRGAYLKNDELHIGYGGQMSVLERKPEKKLSEFDEGDAVALTAKIVEAGSVRKYERDGAIREMCSCTVNDGTSSARLVLWEPNARALETSRPGDSVRIENARMRNGEIHAGGFAKVTAIRLPVSPSQITSDFEGEVEGEIASIGVSGDGILARLDGGKDIPFLIQSSLSLRFLGFKSLPEDIRLETLVNLKGPALVGSKVRVNGKSEVRGGELVFLVLGIG